MPPTLRVPDVHRAAIIELTNLDPARLAALVQAVDAVNGDGERTRQTLVDMLTNGDEAYDALLSVTASRIAHNLSTTAVAEMLRDSLGDEAGTTDFRSLLDSPCILRLSKRLDLATAFERGLHTFRIITDIRPVFNETPATGIEAAIVTHSVQLTYIKAGQFKEVYMVADEDDLKSIQEQVDRALEKGAQVRSLIRKAGATVLENPGEGR